VTVSGRIAEVRETRAGALSVTELNVTDADGMRLTSTLSTGIFRGVGVDGEDRKMDSSWPVSDSVPMGEVSETIIAIDRGFPHRYTECANIWNPIHTERMVALAAGLPDIIVHGTALWALAGKTLLSHFAPDAPQRLKNLSGRFGAMVIPGNAIVVRHGKVSQDGNVAFEVLNAQGETAIADGRATVAAG
jgi:acyl dehydratase